MKISKEWEKDGYVIRLAQEADAECYFEQNYNPLDKEAAHLTGCKEVFTKEEVVSFFLKSVEDDDRYFFLIISPDGRIIGESVINEIDWKLRSANFQSISFITLWKEEKVSEHGLQKQPVILPSGN